MSTRICRACGRKYRLSTQEVLDFVRQQSGTVRPADVAAHFDVPSERAVEMMARMANDGVLCRVRYGHYSADMELARKMLLERLERLTPA
jgi:Mn-dependent DtxR family transcriptional regulator